MAKKRFKAEQIVLMLREAELQLAKGLNNEEACRNLGIAPQSNYRWRKEYGGMKIDQAKRLKEHNVIPVIQSTLYSNMVPSKKIEELDRLLKQYDENNGLYYIDLNKLLATYQSLKKEYSLDGTHLTSKGFEVWREEVESALKKYGL